VARRVHGRLGPQRPPFVDASARPALQGAAGASRGLQRLQGVLGNQALQRLALAGQGGPVHMQRARLNMRGNGTVSGVSVWPDRPSSNLRGHQGQHLTAYVAFQDAILSHVKDRTVPEAVAALIILLGDIRDLPGMTLRSADYLQGPIDANLGLLRDNADNTAIVGEVIDNILSIRNKVPGTAEHGTGGGHGEAGFSGTLETVETALRRDAWPDAWDADVVENQCRYSMWRLLD